MKHYFVFGLAIYFRTYQDWSEPSAPSDWCTANRLGNERVMKLVRTCCNLRDQNDDEDDLEGLGIIWIICYFNGRQVKLT